MIVDNRRKKAFRNNFFNHLKFANYFSQNRAGKIGQPIFSDSELQNEPVKWLKKLLLVRVGLSSMEQLSNEIHRYSSAMLDQAEQDCIDLVDPLVIDKREFMVVFKKIPPNNVGLLPNFRAYSIDDIIAYFNGLRSNHHKDSAEELWFCINTIDNTAMSLGGRLLIPCYYAPECIELVWHTTPRFIEKLTIPEFEFPFLRGVREVGKLFFDIETLFFPLRFSKKLSFNKNKYLSEWLEVTHHIDQNKENIDLLCSILRHYGAQEISLEFCVNNGKFMFIDWDTAIELFD